MYSISSFIYNWTRFLISAALNPSIVFKFDSTSRTCSSTRALILMIVSTLGPVLFVLFFFKDSISFYRPFVRSLKSFSKPTIFLFSSRTLAISPLIYFTSALYLASCSCRCFSNSTSLRLNFSVKFITSLYKAIICMELSSFTDFTTPLFFI